MALIPGLNEPRHLDRQGHRDQIKWLLTGLVNQEEHPIDTGHGAFELATVPRADEPELFAVFSENGIIDDPSPLPATVGGGAFVLGMAPNGDEHLKAQAPESFEPRAFGQSVEQSGRDILVPS